MVEIADIASVATAVGVAAGIYQLRLSWKQGRASFEQTFVDRYWSIEDDRLRGTDSAQVNRQRYLRLCEDQFEHARLRQISRRTWSIWHDGIKIGWVTRLRAPTTGPRHVSRVVRMQPIAVRPSDGADHASPYSPPSARSRTKPEHS